MRLRSTARWIAIAGVIAIAAAACSSNKGGGGATTTPSGTTTTTSSSGPTKGGSVVFGAEQWPQCLNPITTCATASWYLYTVEEFVLPRLIQWNNQFQPTPSDLITEVPSLANGGLTENPFSITYHLNPKAVWSDGTPITCDDVAFTRLAILDTTGTVSTVGYTDAGGAAGISNVDCSGGPQTVKLVFSKPYADWVDLFGGASGFILEKAAFPSEANAAKPDLKDEMNNAIPFSGGPWILKQWDPKNQGVLVPNTKYWGHQPYLSQVTFVPREDQPTEVASILSGDVDAVFPQPSNVPFADQFKQNPNVKAVGGNGNFVEDLWFQVAKAPMNDPKVRQALAYGVDRSAVIQGVIGLNNPNAQVSNCAFWIAGQGDWCSSPGPFAQYTYNPTKADQILTSDGYNCKDVANGGFCTKNGQPLTITISTTAGNVRRATTFSLLQQKALGAGINLQIQTYVPTDLFTNIAPQGKFQVALYAQGPIIDPTATAEFACDQIPNAGNHYSGYNWDHWCNTQATTIMKQSDTEVDRTKRAQEIQQLDTIMAQDLPVLPLDILPNIAAWRTDKIAGVDPADVSNPYGFFFNMANWYVPQG